MSQHNHTTESLRAVVDRWRSNAPTSHRSAADDQADWVDSQVLALEEQSRLQQQSALPAESSEEDIAMKTFFGIPHVLRPSGRMSGGAHGAVASQQGGQGRPSTTWVGLNDEAPTTTKDTPRVHQRPNRATAAAADSVNHRQPNPIGIEMKNVEKAPMRAHGYRQARVEAFFDAFCVGEEEERASSGLNGRSSGRPSGICEASETVDMATTTASMSKAVLQTEGSGAVSPVLGFTQQIGGPPQQPPPVDITVLLEAPSICLPPKADRDAERRMSSLMDAPMAAFEPQVHLEPMRPSEKVPTSRAEGQRAHANAAARHLSIPYSQHSTTVGAMVSLLCTAFERFDVRLEVSRAECEETREADSISHPTRPPLFVESLRPDEVEIRHHDDDADASKVFAIDPAKWNVFDAVLQLPEPNMAADAIVFGMGMAYIRCRIAGHRPLLSDEAQRPSCPLSLLAAHAASEFVTLLLPSAQYYALSLESHAFVGLALPLSVTCAPIAKSTAQQLIIVPSLNIMPLPVRSGAGDDGQSEETSMVQNETVNAYAAEGRGFRFHANPLAPPPRSSSAHSVSPAKSSLHRPRSASRHSLGAASHVGEAAPIEEESGYAIGPYTTEGRQGDGGDGNVGIFEDDWHVPLATLDAIVHAFVETQFSHDTLHGQ